mgnify:CR=1 FL=1
MALGQGAKALPSVTHQPDESWVTDICHVWCGRDRRGALAAVIDHCTREILGWRLSSSGSEATAEAALEEALINLLGHLQRAERPLMLVPTAAWCSPRSNTPPPSERMD